tara:strand:- start:13 stop:432 length:420 start_codon:yes stop_codon:yes gene_type:complete
MSDVLRSQPAEEREFYEDALHMQQLDNCLISLRQLYFREGDWERTHAECHCGEAYTMQKRGRMVRVMMLRLLESGNTLEVQMLLRTVLRQGLPMKEALFPITVRRRFAFYRSSFQDISISPSLLILHFVISNKTLCGLI